MRNLSDASDADLVAAARAGSQEAYRQIVLRYQRPVYGLVARMVGEATAAEDVAQEAFIKAFAALGRYDPKRKFSSWLFKIAHNATIDHLRRREPATVPLTSSGAEAPDLAEVLADDRVEAPDRRTERGQLARQLAAALAELRPEYREIVVLRYQEGLSYNELAEIMELPLGTIKTHLHRARKELAARAAAHGLGSSTLRGETRRRQPS